MQLPDAEQLLIQLTERIRRDMTPSTALVGIHTGGVWLAQRLHQNLQLPLPSGALDVSFYRDDFALIDRGGRELPIAPEYVGEILDVPTDKMLALERSADGVLSLSLYSKIPNDE
jgi:pyrimidine operon attenuation protein/uracil phosphoribosyltransferase